MRLSVTVCLLGVLSCAPRLPVEAEQASSKMETAAASTMRPSPESQGSDLPPFRRSVPFPPPEDCGDGTFGTFTRQYGYPAFWVTGGGLRAGNQTGVFFEGAQKVLWQMDQTLLGVRLSGLNREDSSAEVKLIGQQFVSPPAVASSLYFSRYGCWTVRAENQAGAFVVQVYVFPYGCRPAVLVDRQPPPAPKRECAP